MRKRMTYRLLYLALLIAASPVMAQAPAPLQNGVTSESPVSMEEEVVPVVQSITPISMPSLLFNYWEQTAINEAKKSALSGGFKRDVTEAEINRAMNQPLDQERRKPPPEEREITLGGIVFTTQNEWTIWLNGQRVTPDALPKEIIDLKVYKHHIDMKWQDEYTRRLYPIRLRAHQRFNLDNRLFLPG